MTYACKLKMFLETVVGNKQRNMFLPYKSMLNLLVSFVPVVPGIFEVSRKDSSDESGGKCDFRKNQIFSKDRPSQKTGTLTYRPFIYI